MIVDSTNPRIMADNIRELARNGGGGGGSDLPHVTAADNGKVLGVVEGSWNKMNAPSGVSHYKVTSGTLEGTFAEVLADLTAGKLVCIDLYAEGGVAVSYFRDGFITLAEDEITELGFYSVANKIQKYILSRDGSFTLSREYPLVTDYSTSEKDTGQKWIDGSSIYQKTFSFENDKQTFTDYVVGAVAPEISGNVLSMNFSCKRYLDGSFYGYITGNASNRGEYSTGNFIAFQFRESDTSIIYRCDGYGLQIKEMYVTVLYTKATATATRKRKTTKGEN